jgi:hypothetical protein
MVFILLKSLLGQLQFIAFQMVQDIKCIQAFLIGHVLFLGYFL